MVSVNSYKKYKSVVAWWKLVETGLENVDAIGKVHVTKYVVITSHYME